MMRLAGITAAVAGLMLAPVVVDAELPPTASNAELADAVNQLQKQLCKHHPLDPQCREALVSLDASPAPGSDWAGDQTAKRARFGGNLNITRNFFSPSQTLTWNTPMLTAVADFEVPHVSKKARLTRTEIRAFLDTIPARHPLVLFTFNHEVKPADMSAATYLSVSRMVREEINASGNRGRVLFVANFNHYQLEHVNTTFWRDYLGITQGVNPRTIWDAYSEDIYNESWLARTTGGFESINNLVGAFGTRSDYLFNQYGMRSAIVEFGANQEAGGAAAQAQVYRDLVKWADGHRHINGIWTSQATALPMLWVGVWADNSPEYSPVWHDANSYQTHPVAQFVRAEMVESRGWARDLPALTAP